VGGVLFFFSVEIESPMNNQSLRSSSILILILFIFLAACGGSGDSQKTLDIERPTPPAEYAGKTNPLAADTAAETGKQLYTANCASCHGAAGMGDGPAANSLNPKPKPLATEMSSLEDDYLYWRIAEGGAFAPFSSAMPAWKLAFSEDEIWQVVAFLRTLEK
jgi:mono/diheme cytochrome c family protein